MTPDERSDLKQRYLLALLTRDAKIWNAHIAARFVGYGADDDGDEPKLPRRDPAATYLREDPCLHCGTHKRYINSHKCVACEKARHKRAEGALAAVRKRAATQPTQRLGLRISQVRMNLRTQREAIAVVQHVAPKPPRPVVQHSAPSSARMTAMAAGEARYIRETPCKTCGGVHFYTGARTCVECMKIAKRKSRHPSITEPAAPVQLRKPVIPQTPGKFMVTSYIKQRRFA